MGGHEKPTYRQPPIFTILAQKPHPPKHANRNFAFLLGSWAVLLGFTIYKGLELEQWEIANRESFSTKYNRNPRSVHRMDELYKEPEYVFPDSQKE